MLETCFSWRKKNDVFCFLGSCVPHGFIHQCLKEIIGGTNVVDQPSSTCRCFFASLVLDSYFKIWALIRL